MNDDSYPWWWDFEDRPDPMDPRLGTVLDQIQPTRVEDALVAELVYQYVARDHRFAKTFELFWRDRYTDQRWHACFLALLEQYAVTAVGAQGEPLSIARAEGDRDAARETVAEFGNLT